MGGAPFFIFCGDESSFVAFGANSSSANDDDISQPAEQREYPLIAVGAQFRRQPVGLCAAVDDADEIESYKASAWSLGAFQELIVS